MKLTLEQLPSPLKDAMIKAMAALLSDLSHGSPLPPPGEPEDFLAGVLCVLTDTQVEVFTEATH